MVAKGPIKVHRGTPKRRGPMQVNRPIKVKGSTEIKELTQVNYKHGCACELITALAPFQNDNATVECSKL